MLTEIWDRLWVAQPLPSVLVVLATAVVALLLVSVPVLWGVTRHVVTVVHEGGHGLVAVLGGRRLTGIRLHSDTSGLTVSRGRPTGPGMVMTLLAGYTAPALVGAAAAAVLSTGHALVLLWAVLLLLALLLVQIRNLFGLWVVLALGAVVLAVTWWASPPAQSGAAYLLTWFLLLAAPRTVVELGRSRRQGGARTSDPDQLAGLTRVPGALWVALFWLVAVAAAVAGAALLLPDLLAAARAA